MSIDFLNSIEKNINNDIKKIINSLDGDKLLIFILMQQEIMFSTLELTNFEQKEKLSESFAYVINLIKHYRKLKIKNLSNYNITEYINSKIEILEYLTSLLLTKSTLKDFKIYISKQGYILNTENNFLTLEHEIQDYIKYYKLGYLRNVIEDMFLSSMSMKNHNPQLLELLQIAFEKQLKFYEIIDRGTKIERIQFLFSEPLFNLLSSMDDSHTEYKISSSFHLFFSNNNISINNQCSKSTNIRWIDLLKLSIVIHNISLFMDNTLKKECININGIMFNNSILFPFGESELFDLLKCIFNILNTNITDKNIQDFIRKFTTDLTKSKLDDILDIQFKPFVKIFEDCNYVLFRTFGAMNLVRAYLFNNQMGLDDQGNKFEETVKEIFSKRFTKIKDNIKYKNSNNEKGEIDLCILANKNIYFVECKNKLHPISASSATNNYEYIKKASEIQLPKAVSFFNENRTKFIKQYFNETLDNPNNIQVHKIVILSNRNLSGLNYKDTAIRDVYSLDRILSIGHSNIGYMSSTDNVSFEESSQKIHFWEDENSFQEVDLINYLSNHSKFFTYLEDNVAIPIKRQYQYKDYTFEYMIYAYHAYQKK